MNTGRLFPLTEFVAALGGKLSALLPPPKPEECDDVELLEDGAFSGAASDLLCENMSPSVSAAGVIDDDSQLRGGCSTSTMRSNWQVCRETDCTSLSPPGRGPHGTGRLSDLRLADESSVVAFRT